MQTRSAHPQPEQPLVTASVLCYNHSKFVTQCLEAVRNQTYKNIELIVVDDYSKDNSVAVIKEWMAGYNGRPAQFIQHATNQGVCRSLNDVIAAAKGKYFSMVAADDFWQPDKIQRQVEMLESEPDHVGIVYSDVYRVDENGSPLPQDTYISSHVPTWPPPDGNIATELWDNGNWIPPMGTLIRRNCFEKVGPYDETLWAEDWDMWLRMAEHYQFKFSNEISASYRILSTSMVRSSWPKICESSVRMCLKHLSRSDLPASLRAHVRKQLAIWAKRCYSEGTPNYKRHLFSALRYRPALDTAASFLVGASGVPFKHYTSWAAAVRGRRTLPGVRSETAFR